MSIVVRSAKQVRKAKADRSRIDRTKAPEIRAMIAADPDTAPDMGKVRIWRRVSGGAVRSKPKTYRDSASFGKRQEFIAIAELLRRGFDVYTTLVDDQQIDCVVRFDGNMPSYVDVQIKARSDNAKQPGLFPLVEIHRPRDNFFFIFFSQAANSYWVLPSRDVTRLGTSRKSGKNQGKFSLNFVNTLASGKVKPRPKFEPFRNNFDLLKAA